MGTSDSQRRICFKEIVRHYGKCIEFLIYFFFYQDLDEKIDSTLYGWYLGTASGQLAKLRLRLETAGVNLS